MPAARETQVSIWPAARSGSVSSVSRCSTAPASTRVRQVPQNPCRHEYGAGAPQRRQQGLVGGHGDRRAGRGHGHLERPAVDHRRRGEPFEVQLDVVAVGQGRPYRAQHRRRTARVHRGVGRALTEKCCGAGQPGLVVGADLDCGPVAGDFVEERQTVAAAAGVDHRPVHPQAAGRPQHRQDRGDPDAAGDEAEAARRGSVAGHGQRERVTRTVGVHDGALGERVVHLDRPAAAPGDASHRDPVGAGARIPAQRVLPHQAARQVQVQVGAGVPAGQRPAACRRQRQLHHVLVAGHDAAPLHAQPDGVVTMRGRGDPAARRGGEQPGDAGAGKRQHRVVPAAARRAGRGLPVRRQKPHHRCAARAAGEVAR